MKVKIHNAIVYTIMAITSIALFIGLYGGTGYTDYFGQDILDHPTPVPFGVRVILTIVSTLLWGAFLYANKGKGKKGE